MNQTMLDHNNVCSAISILLFDGICLFFPNRHDTFGTGSLWSFTDKSEQKKKKKNGSESIGKILTTQLITCFLNSQHIIALLSFINLVLIRSKKKYKQIQILFLEATSGLRI